MPLRPTYPVCTDRLQLRPLSPPDTPALLAYHASPTVHRYLPMPPMDTAAIAARLDHGLWSTSTLEDEGGALFLGVEVTASQELIGDVMLRWVSAVHRCGELGYAFHPDHGGLGYATEASHAVLHLAFDELDLHRVIARIDARNTPSLRLARRLGMRQEAHMVESRWEDGGWTDEIDFALLRHEWAAGRGRR
jgi:RimJ/RimL family protein N-acetyltransferase